MIMMRSLLQWSYRLLLRGLYEALRNPNPAPVHRALFYLLLWLCPIGGGVSSTYYVAKTGSDAWPGTEASPKLTLGGGCALLAGGDTLIVGDGTYDEQIMRFSIPSGSAGLPTTIRAANRNQAILRPTQDYGNANCLAWIDARSYIIIWGIYGTAAGMRGREGASFGFYTTDSHHIVYEAGTVRDGFGLGVDDGTGIEFKSPTHHCSALDMDLHDNGESSFDHGIYVSGDDNLVDGCRVSGNFGYGIHFYSGVTGTRNVARHNESWANGSSGILLAGIPGANLAYNNICHSNGSHGLTVFSDSNKAWNNTFYANGGAAVYIRNTATGTELINNIMFGNGVDDVLNDGSGTIDSYNLKTNPGFSDAAGGDFSLQAASPARGYGTNLSSLFTDDFSGATRPATGAWDAGALMYGSVYLQATGGATGYTWEVTGGALPPGISLNPDTGQLSGVPSTSGTYQFTVGVSDSSTPTQTDEKSCTLVIAPPPPITIAGGKGDTRGVGPATATSVPVVSTDALSFVAMVNWYAGAGVTAITFSDSKGNVWIPLTRRLMTVTIFGVAVPIYSQFYYCAHATSVGINHTFTAAGPGTPIFVSFQLFGFDHQIFGVDQTAQAIANVSPVSAGAITPSISGTLIVSGISSMSQNPITVDSGFTRCATPNTYAPGSNFSNATAWLFQAAAAAINPAWSFPAYSDDGNSSVETISFLLV